MADTGWLSPTACFNWSTDVPGTQPWADENNNTIGAGGDDGVNAASDGKHAELQASSSARTKYLRVNGFDTSGIPSGATIDGVEVRVTTVAAQFEDEDEVRLSLSASIVGDDKSTGSAWPNGGSVTFGGTADDWNAGLAWDDAIEVALSAIGSFPFGNALDIDHVELRVTYTAGAAGNPWNAYAQQ